MIDTKKAYNFYLPFSGGRKNQLDVVSKLISENLDFERLEVIETGASQNIEDGCFGLFFCKLALDSGGSFSSVDIDPEISFRSEELFRNFFGQKEIKNYAQDSVEFLKNYKGSPNLVHLDSWDLDLKNPVPSMLHGWLEFEAIKDKMPPGSICIIDDNFLKGTYVYWNWLGQSGEIQGTEVIDVTYDILGKGAMIYHWAQKPETDWDLIGDHYGMIGENIKVIVKKR
jgi:hypothetical protein